MIRPCYADVRAFQPWKSPRALFPTALLLCDAREYPGKPSRDRRHPQLLPDCSCRSRAPLDEIPLALPSLSTKASPRPPYISDIPAVDLRDLSAGPRSPHRALADRVGATSWS